MQYANSINVKYKFKKGDYVKVIHPHSPFRGLVFRVNRRRYTDYYLEIVPEINIPYSKLRLSRQSIALSLGYRSFSAESLKLYTQDRLDGDKL